MSIRCFTLRPRDRARGGRSANRRRLWEAARSRRPEAGRSSRRRLPPRPRRRRVHRPVRLGPGTISARRAAASSGTSGVATGSPSTAVTTNRRVSSSRPFNRCVPCSRNVIPAPETMSRTEAGTRTSPGPPTDITRAAVFTATPLGLPLSKLELAERHAGPGCRCPASGRSPRPRRRNGSHRSGGRASRRSRRRPCRARGHRTCAAPGGRAGDDDRSALPSGGSPPCRDRRRADDVREQDGSETTPGSCSSPLHVAECMSRSRPELAVLGFHA